MHRSERDIGVTKITQEDLMFKRARGTRDFLPEEMAKRRYVERVMRDIAERWCYEEVKTPTFEHVDVFKVKSGEEIINSMYTFEDRSDRLMALRPEMSAPVMRMYVNSDLQVRPKPLRLYYFDNCFRYERPQQSRFREFWQFGAELIGSPCADADAEVIALACDMLRALGIKSRVHVGHLGILDHVIGNKTTDERMRIMRELDKKEIKLDVDLADLDDTSELNRLEGVMDLLDCYGVDYVLDLSVVRGLDYYTGITFEIYEDDVQICGGGEYRLAELFGGEDIRSTGFSFGFDRVAELCETEKSRRNKIAVIATEDTKRDAIRIASKLRNKFPTFLDVMDRNMKGQISFANAVGADWAVIVGKRELKEDKVSLKDMETGEQRVVGLDECEEFLTKMA